MLMRFCPVVDSLFRVNDWYKGFFFGFYAVFSKIIEALVKVLFKSMQTRF